MLVTKHVPCHVRAAAYSGSADDEETNEDGWVTTARGSAPKSTAVSTSTSALPSTSTSQDHSQDEAYDIEDLEEIGLEDDSAQDAAVYVTDSKNASTRTYNLFITYSTSYRVPKFYLSGFSQNGSPLKPDEMFEDIVGDYKDKTVTIEKAPFEEDLTLISIHPCRHANVMRILLDRAEARLQEKQNLDSFEVTKGVAKLGLAPDSGDVEAGDDWEEIEHHGDIPSADDLAIRVDQYLIIFLKFIASVTPGIEHDFTMAM